MAKAKEDIKEILSNYYTNDSPIVYFDNQDKEMIRIEGVGDSIVGRVPFIQYQEDGQVKFRAMWNDGKISVYEDSVDLTSLPKLAQAVERIAIIQSLGRQCYYRNINCENAGIEFSYNDPEDNKISISKNGNESVSTEYIRSDHILRKRFYHCVVIRDDLKTSTGELESLQDPVKKAIEKDDERLSAWNKKFFAGAVAVLAVALGVHTWMNRVIGGDNAERGQQL